MTDHTLNRLRAANPSPEGTAVNADALFDQIVLSTADRRLGHTPRRRRRPMLLVAIVIVVCGLLASGAYGVSGLFDHIIHGPTVKAEYAAAQKQLTLPPGHRWPPLNWPKNSVTSRGAGGSFAVSVDQDAWECYWVDAIHSGDVASQRRANAALDDLMANHIVIAPGSPEDYTPPQSERTPTLAFADDGGYQYKQRMYAEAAAGKPRLLEQSCLANGP